MTNLDSLRKQLTHLTDEAILEVSPGDLTEEAKVVYDAELASRNLNWPAESSAESAAGVQLSGFPKPGEAELVLIATFDNFAEARFAYTLLGQEQIPAWLAGTNHMGQLIDPSGPLRLVTLPQHLESAQMLLSSEISDEELALLAEEAGEDQKDS